MKARVSKNTQPCFGLRGKQYKLNCSVKVIKEICRRHQSLENFLKSIDSMEQAEQLDELIWMIQLLMEQGAVLEKLEGGSDVTVPTVEELEVLLGLNDINALYEALPNALSAGMAREIKTEEPDEKNITATQG